LTFSVIPYTFQIQKTITVKLNSSILFISLLFLVSCSVEPKEIMYGNDHCNYCDMTVVDKSHSAQYVTKKGKAYMFDAVECMVREINESQNEENLAFVLVADFSNPGNLVDAETATYLISEKIKSPMGANLSAFESIDIAEQHLDEFGGDLYSWTQIKDKLSK